MDFDLFEFDDEEDELFRSAQIDPTEQQQTAPFIPSDCLPELHCAGEDTQSAEFASDGFIKCSFLTNDLLFHNSATREICALSNYEFGGLHEQAARYLFGDACMAIQYLSASVHGAGDDGSKLGHQHVMDDDNMPLCYQRRRQVTELLHIVLHLPGTEQWPVFQSHLSALRALINRVANLDCWRLIYHANSNRGNACNIPAYHLMHGIFEWRLLDICILYKYELSPEVPGGAVGEENDSLFREYLEVLVKDLLLCSLLMFLKKQRLDLLTSSSYPCTCCKEMWLLIQFALTRWNQIHTWTNLQFWDVFNRCMARLKNDLEALNVPSLRFCEFGNWMLHSLTRLYGYRSNGQYVGIQSIRAQADNVANYEYLELCTREILQHQSNEEALRIFITILTPTLLEWWPPSQVNVPMMLWEYFHKRFNSSFYIPGATPDTLAVACHNGRDYLKRYRDLLSPSFKLDCNLSSYTLFVILLGRILERTLHIRYKSQRLAQKILGRIYSKFSVQKFIILNETGLHHLIELFIVLLLSGDYNELAIKLRDQLLSIAFDKISSGQRQVVARGHAALLILSIEQQHDISEHIRRLLQQLLSIRNELSVARIFGDMLYDIFKQTQSSNCGAMLLIDAWLPQLLSECAAAEQDRILESIHLCFLHNFDGNNEDKEHDVESIIALQQHILPFVKQRYAHSPSLWLPQLAADFCRQAALSSSSSSSSSCGFEQKQNSFERLLIYFVDTPNVNRQYCPEFLLKLLESEHTQKLLDPSLIIHVWLKSVVLLGPVNESVMELGRYVIHLPTFHRMVVMDVALNNNEMETKFLKCKEPLCVFVSAVGQRYESCESDFMERRYIADQFNSYVRNFDHWLPTNSDDQRSGSNSSSASNLVAGINFTTLKKSDVVYRFYSFLAIVIYNCAHIVYTKAKINCFFHVAMTRFILPTGIQMQKQPETRYIQIIHKIWPVLVQGLGHLNFKSDPYITKTLTDFIHKWTPHFKCISQQQASVLAKPFIACLHADNNELTHFVFDRLTSAFLTTHRRQADQHACLVVTIFQEIIVTINRDSNTTTSMVNCIRQMETLMRAIIEPTLEHIMMVDEVVPSRKQLLEMFRRLITGNVFIQTLQLQSLFLEQLRLLTAKHLAYYTFFYFDLLTQLAGIRPALIDSLMEYLSGQVSIVEAKRGVGADQRMRGCLQKLQNFLATKTSESGVSNM